MGSPIRNLLLEVYRKRAGTDLLSRFEPVALPFRTVLYESDVAPRYVHLMTSGAASIVATMSNGDLMEVGFIGNEGFPEALFLLGPQTASRKCMIQVQGTALRMRFTEFRELYHQNPVIHGLVSAWVQYETLVLGQIAACNGLHCVEERLARWLLMVQDRIGSPDLPLTQDLLGQMLGARRSTVTLAAGNLQRTGLIEYRRGRICIQDRPGLEEVACECYAVTHRLFHHLYR